MCVCVCVLILPSLTQLKITTYMVMEGKGACCPKLDTHICDDNLKGRAHTQTHTHTHTHTHTPYTGTLGQPRAVPLINETFHHFM